MAFKKKYLEYTISGGAPISSYVGGDHDDCSYYYDDDGDGDDGDDDDLRMESDSAGKEQCAGADGAIHASLDSQTCYGNKYTKGGSILIIYWLGNECLKDAQKFVTEIFYLGDPVDHFSRVLYAIAQYCPVKK